MAEKVCPEQRGGYGCTRMDYHGEDDGQMAPWSRRGGGIRGDVEGTWRRQGEREQDQRHKLEAAASRTANRRAVTADTITTTATAHDESRIGIIKRVSPALNPTVYDRGRFVNTGSDVPYTEIGIKYSR